ISTATAAAEATSATAAAAKTTTAATAAKTAGARLLRPRFIDGEGPALEILAIERGNRLFGLFVRRHFNEAEAFRAPAVPIRDQAAGIDRAVLAKKIAQRAFGYREGKIPYVDFFSH